MVNVMVNVKKKTSHKRFRRGIFLLPSLFTLASMLAGFYSIVEIVQYYTLQNINSVEHACYALFAAMLLDSLDGRVARMTATQSDFGAELDSLSDLVSFGLAPALLVYYSMLYELGRLGWLVCFIFAACVALRLARFNSQDENINHRYFRGLSSPIGAGVVSSCILILARYDLLSLSLSHYAALIVVPIVSLLMVSKLRYRSFKDVDLRRKVPFIAVICFLLSIALLVYHPALVVLVLFSSYALSGPLLYLWRMYLVKRIRKKK